MSEAKIHIRLERYAESVQLLNEAVAYFAENNQIEHIRARLLGGIRA